MSLTRRELVAAFLGAPLALAAGCGETAPPLPPGRLVGAAHDFGHRLRDGVSRSTDGRPSEEIDVLVVGGGVAGLTAVWRLQRAGVTSIRLLELEPAPGGTARSGDDGIVPYPWGAHYIPAPQAHQRGLVTLLDEMEVLEGRTPEGEPIVAEQFCCRDPEERIFYRGRWYEGLYLYAGASADDLDQWHRFQAIIEQWVAWRDGAGRRAFTIPIAACSDDAEVTALDRTTMADWIDREGFLSPRLRWLVDYSCRDDYGLTLEQTSAWAGLFYFASRVPQPGAEPQPLITWPEGNGRLVAHLYQRCREQVLLNWAASEIVPATEPGGRVAVRAISADGTSVRTFSARQVIFAAPQFLSRYLIRPWRSAPPPHVAEFEYGSWMVANLFLTGRPESLGFPLAWDNVLYDSPALGYVTATHQRLLDYGPTILTYYYPLCDADPRTARERLLQLGRDEWAEITLTDLQRAHPGLRHLVERLDVMRWGHAMIRPRPGFIWGSGRRAAQQPVGGIHFAHADLSGVALFEEAFHHGVRAAEEVLLARGLTVESLL